MTSKVELVTVNTPLNSTSFQQQINNNFEAIEESLNKQLQREPQEDVNNAMQQEFDMNSYRIINLGAPINPSDAARKQDVDDALKPDLESNRVLISDSEGNISNSSITSTELEALDNISGNIQEQINSKQDTISDLDEIRAGAASGASALQAEDLNLSNCNDVDLTNPAEGDALIYNSISQKWENREVRQTYRGVYDAAVTYAKGDIVAYGSYFYIAKNTTTGNAPNDTAYWSEISNDGLVNYAEKTDNVEYPVGFTNYGISSNIYSGSMNFTTTSSPTINASTGALTAAVLKTTTQTQGDNSTNAATTAYVDAAVGSVSSEKQDTLVSGTNIKTVNNASLLGSGDISIQPSYNSSTNTLEF